MLSKELLSEVLGYGILDVGEVDDNYLSFKYFILDDDCIDSCINIHELAHKVKKWAFIQGYDIDSFIAGCDIVDSKTRKVVCEIIEQDRSNQDRMYNPENEIKACQWILDNKKNNVS